MKIKHRKTSIAAFAIVAIGLSLVVLNRQPQAVSDFGGATRALPPEVPRSSSQPVAAIGKEEPANDSSEADKIFEARGSGYLWGTAIKTIYSESTRTPDGKRHLHLTEIGDSFEKFRRPMSLEDASAPSQARAEYLASVITSALDLSAVTDQPRLAGVLRAFYLADSEQRNLEPEAQDEERAHRSAQARDELLPLLPAEAQGLFKEVFACRDFLFRTMSVAADEITSEKRGGSVVAKGGAVFIIKPDGLPKLIAPSIMSEVNK